ncbi:MAG: isocitrate/isopropylmalate dehydrogenase family protein [Deltaproteobacteria bacterium]|nr:isocitrate/isopropylmalate dehydrogenase family protein [Deltaproteobacteria bacterium]MDQ3297749.1 isocitrate/isopropylmalate dehydrogenase family protein [Myxococcota bacterium]
MTRPTASLIEGDGIGPEIAAATVRAVEAAGGQVTWERVDAGAGAVDKHKDPLPQATIDSIKQNQLALKGPLATPSGGGYRSVNVTLRQQFDLYANVRPVRTIAGVPSRYTDVDLVIVRENTEDLYAGVEHYVDPRRTAAESIAIITKFGSERVIIYAFEYARRHGRKKITLVHKANILKMSNGLFLDCGRDIAKRYPDIAFDDMIVDATAMKLVLNPERFDVIVTMNLFGDILSDLTAGLVGGLGVAPAANIGSLDSGGCAMFEAVHGTAPDIAGKGIANPTGLMLSAAMLLDYVEQREAGDRLRKGVYAALAAAETRTGDLGGKANTEQYTDAVIRLMR